MQQSLKRKRNTVTATRDNVKDATIPSRKATVGHASEFKNWRDVRLERITLDFRARRYMNTSRKQTNKPHNHIQYNMMNNPRMTTGESSARLHPTSTANPRVANAGTC
eukprot:2868107-Lingulodinium_polyedra.AAC.1